MNKSVLALFTFLSMLMLLVSCGKESEPQEEKCYYFNPLFASNCPDPTVIDDRARTGYFYAYSTRSTDAAGKTYYLPVHRSKDMYHWETFVADGWEGKPPVWVEGSSCWAPDINYVDGHYVLYYALGVWGGLEESASGVAVSDSPTGPFVDKGMVVSYQNTGVKNSIDPMLFVDGDKKYLYWGSFNQGSGIWVVELSDDCLKIKEGCKPTQIGFHNMEGSYVIKRNGYYYFFGSKGSCCEGSNSTYHIIVARSKSPLGPFEGRDGTSLMSSGYNQTIMQSSTDKAFIGTGHNAQIITDDAGKDWMYYHSFCSRTKYYGRLLCMDEICWDSDGWPTFKRGCEPSNKYEVPTIKK